MAARKQTEVRVLILGPAAASVRRTLTPTAWVVLEHLAMTAGEQAGKTVSHESVRRIADALDLAKDTVARALRCLADAGLAVYVPGRSCDGRFAPSHYRLTVPPDLFLEVAPESPATKPTRSRRELDRSHATQLSLIDPAPTTF